jgi:hypothetical protein
MLFVVAAFITLEEIAPVTLKSELLEKLTQPDFVDADNAAVGEIDRSGGLQHREIASDHIVHRSRGTREVALCH